MKDKRLQLSACNFNCCPDLIYYLPHNSCSLKISWKNDSVNGQAKAVNALHGYLIILLSGNFAFLELDRIWTFSQPTQRKSSPSFDTCMCVHARERTRPRTHKILCTRQTWMKLKGKKGLGWQHITQQSRKKLNHISDISFKGVPWSRLSMYHSAGLHTPWFFFSFPLFSHLSTQISDNLFPCSGLTSFVPSFLSNSY